MRETCGRFVCLMYTTLCFSLMAMEGLSLFKERRAPVTKCAGSLWKCLAGRKLVKNCQRGVVKYQAPYNSLREKQNTYLQKSFVSPCLDNGWLTLRQYNISEIFFSFWQAIDKMVKFSKFQKLPLQGLFQFPTWKFEM